MISTSVLATRIITIIERATTTRESKAHKRCVIGIFLIFFSSYFQLPPRCHQQCINTIGSFECECYSGFTLNELGLCIDIDECKLANNRCPKASQCINTAGSYNCICPTGMKLSKDKNDCIEIKNECKPLIVKNGAARCTRFR